ncbi:MAG: hypothetical protein ACK4GJ_03125 [bacterium]
MRNLNVHILIKLTEDSLWFNIPMRNLNGGYYFYQTAYDKVGSIYQ